MDATEGMKLADERFIVSDVRELLDLTELKEIITYRLIAERVLNDIEESAEPQYDLDARVRKDDGGIETRFRMHVEAPNARYIADVGGIFVNKNPLDISASIMRDFINEIGIMVVFPYLREAITGLAARLGMAPPLLGFLRRGEGTFGPDPSATTGTEHDA